MTDITFVFIFLPISLLVLIVKPQYQKYVLLLLSLFYYACGAPEYFVLFFIMLVLDVALAYGIKAARALNNLSRSFLFAGILLNIGVLFYYKYYDFTVGEMNRAFGTSFSAKELLLPMGISFFAFKAISLLADVYRGNVVLGRNPVDSALYLSFFGQIVSGPICRYNDFYTNSDLKSIADPFWRMFSEGGWLFVKGFIKKILLANILSMIVAEVFKTDISYTSAPFLWLGAICYSLQLYYDFSGYSDMAIGIGQIYGIYCPKNFDYPYITRSVSEFWRRWHISLGAWFRDYVYIPLGGSKVSSKSRLYFNLFVVWMATGIWHGANWTFIFWGLSYFIVIAVEKTFNLPGRLNNKWSKGIYRALVLAFVNFQWVIFNSADLYTGLRYIKRMLIGAGDSLANDRTMILLQQYGVIIAAAALFAMPVVPWIKDYVSSKGEKQSVAFSSIMALAMGVLFILALSFVIAGQNNPFLYGNF